MLEDGSQAFGLWKKAPVPVYNRFYFYNVTNPQAIEREGAKPILRQIGPFTYEVSVEKISIRDNHNGTLSYRERKSWRFRRSLSIADENYIVTTLNTPLALTLALIQGASSTVRVLITLALDAVTEGFFIRRSIKQLLFVGYPDLLTTFGPLLNPEIPASSGGRFGFMYQKNNTDDGEYTIFSGVNDINLLNIMNRYNGKPKLKYWASDVCNSFNDSTNGQMLPPFTDKSPPQSIRVFSSDACRVLKLKFTRTHQSYPGLQVHRYTLDSSNFASWREYPPNQCYMSRLPEPQPSLLYTLTRPQTSPAPTASPLSSVPSSSSPPSSSQNSDSVIPTSSPTPSQSPHPRRPVNVFPQRHYRRSPFPSGVFDLSACKYGAPLVISQPHFLNSDPVYRKSVIGMMPNQSEHSFWMDTEPMTGSTVSLAARMQLNVAITKGPAMFRYRNIPEIVFPIFWQEYQFAFTSDLAQALVDAKSMPHLISSISFYSLLSAGLILAISSFLVYIIPYLRKHSLEINGKQIQTNISSRASVKVSN